MEIIEATQEEFGNIMPYPNFIFGSSEFAHLNKNKVEETYYLLFKDNKYRLGLIGGVRENIFFSPFSAPFGGFTSMNNNIKISQIDSAVESLINWAVNKKLNSLRIILPPNFYDESFISKQVNSYYRMGFDIRIIDLNYSFFTKLFDKNYKEILWRNARKNLNSALKNNLTFFLCKNQEEKRIAYEIIKKNRSAKGFPLRMTWEQVVGTINIIPADFFLCMNDTNSPIAAAIVFNVAKEIVQVIYWGDIPDYTYLKTMNFLAYKVFEFYSQKGIKIIDIGPSTENSIPNHGLCEFKESIGCNITQKLTFEKQIV